ncbi:MAG: 3-oxoacyl-ACP synthase, partial [Planctomycetes bacterium]|nr:3-oxoacyl-ACP synthase [Planctomycetota bacterium]
MTVRWAKGVFRLLGTGAALPGHAVPTLQFVKLIQKQFGLTKWQLALDLAKQMGITTRYFCRDFVDAIEGPRDDCSNQQLSSRALCDALAEAKIGVHELEYLFAHTATPDTLLPPNISWVADQLGYNGPYAELRQSCTGFANALQLAAAMVESGHSRRIAIVGSETASLWLDPTDADEDSGQLVGLIRMGDGAGAVILGADDGNPGDRISSLFFGALGSGHAPGVKLLARQNRSRSIIGKPSLWEFDLEGVRELGPRLFEEGIRAARLAGVRVQEVNWVL